ncbi:MAG TPA: hypothetical protein VHI11_08260 [Jiangellaceae bacterium]|jgi:hypothetical protein|nr:hypothetical protein [Jiangellaceae bacterium]
MQQAPPSIGLPEQIAGPHNAGGRRSLVIVAVVVTVAIIVSATTLLALRDGQEPAPSGAPAPPSPVVTDPVTTTPTPTANQPSAVLDLATFLSAAATLDGQLHEAAAAINAAGPPWVITETVARKVLAGDLEPVARVIPAGLPPDLLRSVILVYSDLASRRAAMQSFASAHDDNPRRERDAEWLAELANGHEAATRFDADLAATRSLAAATPPIAAVPADSRLVAEKLLLVQFVEKGNFGCNARGGAVLTELPVIIWVPPSWNPDADGTIGGRNAGTEDGAGIDFTADFGPDGGWHVEITAC